MDVQEMETALAAIVNVWLVLEVNHATKVSVPFCVTREATILMVNVTAILDGKERSAS
jgi:hypothetical protein